MASFLTPEQKELVQNIAALLTQREQTVCVAEATTGGLLSAALLSVAGASRYYRGGGVLYTQKSRVALAGVTSEANTSAGGPPVDMLTITAEAMRERLEATWCVAETGTAGPTGGRSGTPPGRTTISIVGPVSRREIVETGLDDRETNMVEFATHALRLFHEALQQ